MKIGLNEVMLSDQDGIRSRTRCDKVSRIQESIFRNRVDILRVGEERRERKKAMGGPGKADILEYLKGSETLGGNGIG
jgi:hypothetical protein